MRNPLFLAPDDIFDPEGSSGPDVTDEQYRETFLDDEDTLNTLGDWHDHTISDNELLYRMKFLREQAEQRCLNQAADQEPEPFEDGWSA